MAPNGIRGDGGNGPQNTQGTTTRGTAATVPLGRQDLYQIPGGGPQSGRIPGRGTTQAPGTGPSGGKTVTARSSDGSSRSLKQLASDEGTSVTVLLSQPGNAGLKQKFDEQVQAQIVLEDPQNSELKGQYDDLLAQMAADPTNAKLRQKYDEMIQQMLDKYRSYDHSQKRFTNTLVVSDQVAETAGWIPEQYPIYVPSRKAPDSTERLLDNKQVDNKSSDRAELTGQTTQVAEAKYQAVVNQAKQMASGASGSEEGGPDLKELYSQGQDHLPLDAKLVSFVYGQQGLKLNASNTWSVASVRASMPNPIDLKAVDPATAKADLIKPGMVVTSRDRSRLEIAVTGIQKDEQGRKGVYVVCADRSGSPDSKAMSYEFRPLSALDTAGYPGTASNVDTVGQSLGRPSGGKKAARPEVSRRV